MRRTQGAPHDHRRHKIRLDLFEETRPIIDYYKKTDRKVIDINGEQSIEKVLRTY